MDPSTNGDPFPLALYIVFMAVCLIFSAYFSATETAFSSLNKTRLKTIVEKGNKRADLALRLSERYDRLISTVLIGNNIVNIALASLGTVLFTYYYKDLGATISTAVITVIVLIFGEVTPKSIAKDMPEKFAMFSAPLLQLLIWLFLPFVTLFTLWKKLISKILKTEEDTKMSQEELLMLVEEVQQDGSIDQDEGNLLKNAIEFTERKAEDILTHRTDLEAVDVEEEKTEISKTFYETQFSRLLVYEENIDNIVGVIHQKDFYTEAGITSKHIKEIMSPPLFVQRSEKINDLLQLLQKNKSHIAVVLDEYGGTYGIVTMEDILEELVGEIWDEHDEVVEEFKQQGEDTWLVDCTVNIDDFCEFFDLELETEAESVSLGGWVMEQLGKVPEEGDAFAYEELEITVTETDFHRVAYVKVKCNKSLKKEEEAEETV
jgi:CBS domain containing-hemolysin-like protein